MVAEGLKVKDFKEWDAVTYIPHHAEGNAAHADCEQGYVYRVTEHAVFVRFKGETGQQCSPHTLQKGH